MKVRVDRHAHPEEVAAMGSATPKPPTPSGCRLRPMRQSSACKVVRHGREVESGSGGAGVESEHCRIAS